MRKQIIYVGNCSNKGLFKYKFTNGKLKFSTNTNDFERCTYLAKDKKNIYGVLEVCDENNKGNGYIVSYTDNKGKITNTCKKSSYGKGPCHISINKNKDMLFVSNYQDGNFVIYSLNNDSIGEVIYQDLIDPQKSHVHYSQMLDGNYLVMVDLGTSTIIIYNINDKMKEVTRLTLGNNIQPRHLVINKNLIYVVTEITCQLYVLIFQDEELKILNKYNLLPQDEKIKDNYTGCAIKISKNKKFIYVSIREHDSISVFKCIESTLKLIQNIKCNGEIPRDIELDKFERYLLVANQNSNNISIFKRNKITGKLRFSNKIDVESPTCIITK